MTKMVAIYLSYDAPNNSDSSGTAGFLLASSL